MIMRRVPGTDEFASVALRPDLFEPLERDHEEATEADAYNGDGFWEPSISEGKDARAAEREKSLGLVLSSEVSLTNPPPKGVNAAAPDWGFSFVFT